MRARNLKPGFFKNEELAELPPLARILFSGLWCLADREGRLEDRPKRIKAELLPYDNCNVEQLLDQLARSPQRFIIRYKVDDCRYIAIPNFVEHQTPHIKEADSTIPAPDEHSTNTVLAQDEPALARALSPSPFPLTPIPLSSKFDSEFETFWSLYPRREGKGAAKKSFVAVAKKTKPETIIEGLQKQLPALNGRERKYVPMPATWLNQERWEDEPADTVLDAELDLIMEKNRNPRRER